MLPPCFCLTPTRWVISRYGLTGGEPDQAEQNSSDVPVSELHDSTVLQVYCYQPKSYTASEAEPLLQWNLRTVLALTVKNNCGARQLPRRPSEKESASKTSGFSTYGMARGYTTQVPGTNKHARSHSLHRVPQPWFAMKDTENPPVPEPLARHVMVQGPRCRALTKLGNR